MGQWFAPVDDVIGAGQDVVTGTGDFLGDTVSGIFGTAGEAAGNAAGGLFGGLFGGLGNWIFQIAALGVVAWVFVQVVA